MRTEPTQEVSPAALAPFAIALGLAVLAAYNYATGAYGGAIVSSIGTVVATLLGLLTES
jgi:hypothetical protein